MEDKNFKLQIEHLTEEKEKFKSIAENLSRRLRFLGDYNLPLLNNQTKDEIPDLTCEYFCIYIVFTKNNINPSID
jgi:hypothetical protein